MLTFLNGIFGAKSEESMAHLERSNLEICATITRDHELLKSFFGLSNSSDLLMIKSQVDYRPLSIRFISFVKDSHNAQESKLIDDVKRTTGLSTDTSDKEDEEQLKSMESQLE